MKCPKCGAVIKAPWELSWIEEYFVWLRRNSPTYGEGTGEW